MLTRRIISCLDVKGGRVVKGVNFLSLKDAGDPAELAWRYSNEGADEVVFLDISASLEERGTMLDVVGRTSEKLFIPLTVGGGIRTSDDVRALLRAGADKISLNTAAIANPTLIIECAKLFGRQCIVVAIDAKLSKDGKCWQVFSHGGSRPTGLDALDWGKKAQSLGAGEILLTSIDRDGVGSGYDIQLTRIMSESLSIPVIASGGAGKMEDFRDVFIDGKADAALAAGVFHYGKIPIPKLKEWLSSQGVAIRIQKGD